MTIDQTTAMIVATSLFVSAVGTLVTGIVGVIGLRTMKRVEHHTNGMMATMKASSHEEGRQEGRAETGKPAGDLVSSHLRSPA